MIGKRVVRKKQLSHKDDLTAIVPERAPQVVRKSAKQGRAR